MTSLNGDLPILKRFRAYDGRDYESRQALIEAAIKDGFTSFKQLLYPTQSWNHRGTYAYTWSYMSCLRLCIESQKTTLILEDDRPLGKPVSEANEVLQQITQIFSEPFRLLQLNWWNAENPTQIESTRLPIAGIKDYCMGLSGFGSQRNIYSPEGAQWLLDAFAVTPVWIEPLTGFYSKFPQKSYGIYSYRYSDKNNPWVTYIPIKNDIQDRAEIDKWDEENEHKIHTPIP